MGGIAPACKLAGQQRLSVCEVAPLHQCERVNVRLPTGHAIIAKSAANSEPKQAGMLELLSSLSTVDVCEQPVTGGSLHEEGMAC